MSRNNIVAIGAIKAKSAAASKVLKLMDKDYSYEEALFKTLRADKRLSRKSLENELNRYI